MTLHCRAGVVTSSEPERSSRMLWNNQLAGVALNDILAGRREIRKR